MRHEEIRGSRRQRNDDPGGREHGWFHTVLTWSGTRPVPGPDGPGQTTGAGAAMPPQRGSAAKDAQNGAGRGTRRSAPPHDGPFVRDDQKWRGGDDCGAPSVELFALGLPRRLHVGHGRRGAAVNAQRDSVGRRVHGRRRRRCVQRGRPAPRIDPAGEHQDSPHRDERNERRTDVGHSQITNTAEKIDSYCNGPAPKRSGR